MAIDFMKLISPTVEYKESYASYIKELGSEERYPFPADFDFEDFEEFLQKIEDYQNGVNIPNPMVPSSTFWLIKNNEIAGITNIRHYLNKEIEYCGGHIGLGVRPSFRGKGIGSSLMKKSIKELNSRGINTVHIHCYKDNIASTAMIIANGGKLTSEFSEGDKVIQRYVVNVIKSR
jgi:predicted acetyltransferase